MFELPAVAHLKCRKDPEEVFYRNRIRFNCNYIFERILSTAKFIIEIPITVLLNIPDHVSALVRVLIAVPNASLCTLIVSYCG